MSHVATTSLDQDLSSDIPKYCVELAERANGVQAELASASGPLRNRALIQIEQRILKSRATIREANAKDLAAATEGGLADSMVERLTLNNKRIEAMAKPFARSRTRRTRPVRSSKAECCPTEFVLRRFGSQLASSSSFSRVDPM